LNRRTLLRGSGGIAIALPWLEVMEPLKTARAAGSAARRFVAVYTPGGTVLDQWLPTGTETAFELSPILKPLEPCRQQLQVLSGLSMQDVAVGDQSAAGMVAWLTGCRQLRSADLGPPRASLDRELAARLARPVLYQAVRWGIGSGQPEAMNTVSYGAAGSELVPAAPEIDPVATWQRLFGEGSTDMGWDKSMLDAVMARYRKLAARVGSRDRRVLEQHLDHLRQMERRLAAACSAPALADTSSYDPQAFDAPSPSSDAAMPVVGKLMIDMMLVALSCDIARVATLQWGDARAAFTLPWLDLPDNQVQNFYENNGGFRPEEMTKIFTWYSTQHAYLLQQMAQTPSGQGSLLDESLVFFGSHQQSPASHSKADMPFLLAGGAQVIDGNRFRRYAGRSHNDLLAGISNLFGGDELRYGDAPADAAPIDLSPNGA
jgi:hypothetical protein